MFGDNFLTIPEVESLPDETVVWIEWGDSDQHEINQRAVLNGLLCMPRRSDGGVLRGSVSVSGESDRYNRDYRLWLYPPSVDEMELRPWRGR